MHSRLKLCIAVLGIAPVVAVSGCGRGTPTGPDVESTLSSPDASGGPAVTPAPGGVAAPDSSADWVFIKDPSRSTVPGLLRWVLSVASLVLLSLIHI